MLEHLNSKNKTPERVVLIGARGFIGQAVNAHLKELGIDTLALTSTDINLLADDAGVKLAELLKPTDSVVMLSALTPDKGRGIDTMMDNFKMAENVCKALSEKKCSYVVYVSSDAVYPFGVGRVSEDSKAEPTDLYGAMHKTRELMFLAAVDGPLAILRPTLVYGVGDTHNSYGPNRFRRLAAKEGKITIGGEGEETRDHIYVADVAKIIGLVLLRKSQGLLNLATGRSISFGDLAQMVASRFENVEVCPTPRGMPITHRTFDTTHTMKSFPGFVFVPLEEGLDLAQKDVE